MLAKPHHKKVTIKQVAQAAGVSTQTVSRVLNERPDVAPATRQQILDIIERLDYQPSALARSLIRQRTHTLGVVIAGLRYIGPSRTLNGITTQAEAMSYSLLLKKLPKFETEEIEPILNDLLARQVDGIIWAVPEIGSNHDWLHQQLPRSPVPIIFLTTKPKTNRSTVSVDNYLGGRLATEHLLKEGYQHIGHLAGPLTWWEAGQRQAGWRDALAEAGKLANNNQWAEGDWSSQSAVAPFKQLLKQYPQMDAVFAANDQMALSVLQVAHCCGLRVPQDLAVVGFDDLPESAYFYPPLTSIQQNLQELGSTAVQQIARSIEASRESEDIYQPETIWLKPQIIVRESSSKIQSYKSSTKET
ncbi:MAG: LacI family DNA-binding transcriptional regulator [Anaerolineae bacterium]|nr:LacI family DNA-binding transcriptional regulator [Anaerolineae bacterium]